MSNRAQMGVRCLIALAATIAASCSLDVRGRDFPAAPGSGDGAPTSSEASATGSGGTGGESAASGTGGDGYGGGGQGGGGQGGQPTPVCGNGVREGSEACDDGNVAPGDRCGSGCAIEDPTTCPGTPIALDSTAIVISDTTTGATNKITDTAKVEYCPSGTWQGEDLVYAVTPMKTGTLKATLKASYDSHYVHIRTGCPGSPNEEIGCDYDGAAANADVSVVPVTGGATYYVFPDSYDKKSGPFQLTLELTPQP